IERRQRIDSVRRNYRRWEGSAVILTCRRVERRAVRIIDTVRRCNGGTAGGRKPRVSREVPASFGREGDRQDGGPVLVDEGNIPGHEEKRPVLAMVNVRHIDGASQRPAKVIKVDARREERPALGVT